MSDFREMRERAEYMDLEDIPFEEAFRLVKPKRKVDRKLLAEIRKLPCCVCGRLPPCDVSHIRTRGSGGPDTKWNCVPKCRLCHIQWGQLGAYKFIKLHHRFRRHLESLGWRLEGFKLRHPGLEAK